jgi:5-methylcytosine-specific restriction endonuclease McrA
MKMYNCLNCEKPTPFGHSKRNKYCSQTCMHEHRYNLIKKPLIEEGKLNKNSLPLLIKYVSERDGYKCSCCGLVDWLGEKLSLDLDHVDVNNTNNLPNNLRLLCPNCHRQTPTWGNKKRD